MSEPLTPEELRLMRMDASHAASLVVLELLMRTVARLGPGIHAQLIAGLDQALAEAQRWSLPGRTPELSMLLADMQEEEMRRLVEGLKRSLGA